MLRVYTRKIILFVIVAIFSFALFGCTKDVKVSKITVTGITEIQVGDVKELTLDIYPADALDKVVIWESSDVNVITVAEGVVTAVASGKATINVTLKADTNIKGSIEITVINPLITSISLTGEAMYVNEEQTLNVNITPSNAGNKNLEWKSSDDAIATVDNGVVKALKAGSVTITATALDGSKIKGTVNITITSVPATGLQLHSDSENVLLDSTLQINPIVSPSNATDKNVIWTSSNETIATVSSTGLVTGLKEGVVVITGKLSSNGSTFESTITLNVKKPILEPDDVKELLMNKYNEYKTAPVLSARMLINDGGTISTLELIHDFSNSKVNSLKYSFDTIEYTSIYVKDDIVYMNAVESKGQYALESGDYKVYTNNYNFDKYFSLGTKYFTDDSFFANLEYDSTISYTDKDNASYKYVLNMSKYTGTTVVTLNKDEVALFVTLVDGKLVSFEFSSTSTSIINSVKIEYLGLICDITYPDDLSTYPEM